MKTKIVSSAQVNSGQDPLAETITILARIIAKYISATDKDSRCSVNSKAGGLTHGPNKSSS